MYIVCFPFVHFTYVLFFFFFLIDTYIDIKESIPKYAEISNLLSDVIFWICMLWMGCSGTISYKGKYFYSSFCNSKA